MLLLYAKSWFQWKFIWLMEIFRTEYNLCPKIDFINITELHPYIYWTDAKHSFLVPRLCNSVPRSIKLTSLVFGRLLHCQLFVFATVQWVLPSFVVVQKSNYSGDSSATLSPGNPFSKVRSVDCGRSISKSLSIHFRKMVSYFVTLTSN